MIHRAVKSVTPFDFRSDFSARAPAPVEARAEGAASVRTEEARAETERLQGVTNALNEALANLVALTGHLEACAYDEGFSDRAHALIRATARTILDGQGDLFDAQQSLKRVAPEGKP